MEAPYSLDVNKKGCPSNIGQNTLSGFIAFKNNYKSLLSYKSILSKVPYYNF